MVEHQIVLWNTHQTVDLIEKSKMFFVIVIRMCHQHHIQKQADKSSNLNNREIMENKI